MNRGAVKSGTGYEAGSFELRSFVIQLHAKVQSTVLQIDQIMRVQRWRSTRVCDKHRLILLISIIYHLSSLLLFIPLLNHVRVLSLLLAN